MAYSTHATMELAHWKGQHTVLALLDCSKCYERVEHLTGAQDAYDSGCPPDIVNTAFRQYAGTRILRAHGAVGPPHLWFPRHSGGLFVR